MLLSLNLFITFLGKLFIAIMYYFIITGKNLKNVLYVRYNHIVNLILKSSDFFNTVK